MPAPAHNLPMADRHLPVILTLGLTAAHLAVGLAVAVSSPKIGGEPIWLFALPVSQASLVAIWLATSRVRSYARVPLGIAGIGWTWFVMVHLLRGDDSAQWAAMLGLQALAVFLLVGTALTARRHFGRQRHEGANTAPPWQYSLASLLIWTTLLAVLLALGKAAFKSLGWTAAALQGQYFFMSCLVGLYDSIYAVLVLAALFAGRRLVLQTLAAAVLIALLAASKHWVLQALFGTDGDVSLGQWLVFAACQAGYIYATLLPPRIYGFANVSPEEIETPA